MTPDGAFSRGPRRFGVTDDPWFRIGTVDIGTSAIAAALVIFGMFIYAAEGPSHSLSLNLAFLPSEVLNGKIWQLVTWFVPVLRPSVWTVLSAAILYLFGSEIERTLGRIRMAWLFVTLLLVGSVLGMIVHLASVFDGTVVLYGESYLGIAILLVFVLYLPSVRFFFGIPGWVIAVVIVGIEFLNVIADRNTAMVVWLVFALVGWMMTAKAFGLANDIDWLPDLPIGSAASTGVGTMQAPKAKRRRRSKGPDLTVVDDAAAREAKFDELEIDQILDQISAFGMESLSKEQRRKLDAFSNKKKKRRD